MSAKLVRNEPGRRIRAEGLRVRVATSHEMPGLLAAKLVEESHEVAEAISASASREALIEELADISEVLTAILTEFQIAPEEVVKAQLHKRVCQGNFSAGLVADVSG